MSALTVTRAEEIRSELHLAEVSLRDSFAHYLNAGGLLADAKLTVGHGNWLDWLEGNVGISEREAQRYMRLAEHREEIEAANPSGMSDLSLTAALKQIAKPKKLSQGDIADTFAAYADEPDTDAAPALPREVFREEHVAFTDQQDRLRRRLADLESDARRYREHASAEGLSRAAIAKLWGDAARAYQRAAVAADNLASSFER